MSLLGGCKKASIRFENIIKLEETKVENFDLVTRGARLLIVDTFLVVQKMEEKFFQIYSTNSHKMLTEFGLDGRGFGEFRGPNLMKQTGFDNNNSSPVVYCYDFKRKKISSINVLDAIKEGKVQEQTTVPGDYQLPYLYYLDSQLLVGAAEGNGRLVIHHLDEDREIFVPYVPDLGYAIPPNEIDIIYTSNSTLVNKKEKLIASAPLFLGQLDFFDFNGNYLRSTIFDDNDKYRSELEAGSDKFRETKYRITSMEAKDDLIFAFNLNSPSKEYTDGTISGKVQVFDWTGNLKNEYLLGDRSIVSFAMDFKKNRIYTFSISENTNSLSYYEFPEITK